MQDDVAIKVRDLHKCFELVDNKQDSIKHILLNPGKRSKKHQQKVLNGIDFEIKKGEFFGIIGRNGSGKSTLLKLLAGVYTPDSGKIEVNGNLTPFIELGVGFNPELSGRDNVYLSSSLLGFTRKQVKEMYNDIVSFAELEEHMDKKLKNYSSGMQVRLAFSIAIRSKSDILLIDEVLAVGDENFQRKCFETFESLKREGRTIVFVTHSMASVEDFCDRGLLLNQGKIVAIGAVKDIVKKYHDFNMESETKRPDSKNATKLRASESDIKEILGIDGAQIKNYRIYNHKNQKTHDLESGKRFKFTMDVCFNINCLNPVYGLMIRKNPKDNLLGVNSFLNKNNYPTQVAGSKVTVEFEGIINLAPGTYYLSIAVADQKRRTNHTDLVVLNNYIKLNVYGPDNVWGLIPNDIKIGVKN